MHIRAQHRVHAGTLSYAEHAERCDGHADAPVRLHALTARARSRT